MINKETKQPYLVIRETLEKCEIAPLKKFHFLQEDISTIDLNYAKELYDTKDMKCFGLLRNSIMTTNEVGDILNNIISYQVEVRKNEKL